MLSVSDRLEVSEISDNFLVKRGLFFTKKEYYRNHIKIVDNDNLAWLRKYMYESFGEAIEPLFMTNTGNLFVYFEEREQIGLFYVQDNCIEPLYDLSKGNVEHFMYLFVHEGSIRPLFNKDMFRFELGYDEILYLPFYLADKKSNYHPVKIDVAYELYRQGF